MPSTLENKVNVYFFRHGETEWNRIKKFQGSHDIPLNETGRVQARELAIKFSAFALDAVLSSDLSRAKETAEIVCANRNIPIFYFAQLREADLGLAEGKYRTDFEREYGPEMWRAWISPSKEFLDFKFPGGETKRETRQRVIDCVEKFISENNCKNIAVSTHGGVISRIIHYCEGAPSRPTPIPNGCLYHVEIQGHLWKLRGQVF